VIVFVAKDAGGANLVLHHALAIASECHFYLFGIAREIAAELQIENLINSVSSNKVTHVISGANFPGEMGEMESLLGEFQAQGIPIDGYIDGWENLGNRFPGINIRNYLVVDDYSEALAKEIYRGKVLRIKNFYLDATLREFYLLRSTLEQNPKGLLYLSRPKLNQLGSYTLHGVNCICPDLQIIDKLLTPTYVIVRDHPLLDSTVCTIEFSVNKKIKISRSKGTSRLAKDLALCDTAVGALTPALGIARDAGLNVYTLDNSQLLSRAANFPILSL